MYFRCPSAKTVSNASVDLPLPDRPVMTTSWSRGMSTLMFLRLCSRAPRMRMDLEVIDALSLRKSKRAIVRRMYGRGKKNYSPPI